MKKVIIPMMRLLKFFGDKLPTKEQFEELKENCTWEWQGNGYKVTGPNENSIFMPASGFRNSYGNVYDGVVGGYYWSSTPYGSDCSWRLGFVSSRVGMNDNYRDFGLSVRLVKTKTPK